MGGNAQVWSMFPDNKEPRRRSSGPGYPEEHGYFILEKETLPTAKLRIPSSGLLLALVEILTIANAVLSTEWPADLSLEERRWCPSHL